MAKAETIHVDVRPHIAAVARPGDTVLIGFAHNLTDEEIEALDESFRPLIDRGLKIGFMDQVVSMVVFRSDEGDELEDGEAAEGQAERREALRRAVEGEFSPSVTLEGEY